MILEHRAICHVWQRTPRVRWPEIVSVIDAAIEQSKRATATRLAGAPMRSGPSLASIWVGGAVALTEHESRPERPGLGDDLAAMVYRAELMEKRREAMEARDKARREANRGVTTWEQFKDRAGI